MQFTKSTLVLASCVLPVVVALIVIIRKRKAEIDSHRSPFKELQRRPAGEALRLKLEGLDDKINEQFTLLLLIPTLLAVVLTLQRQGGWIAPLLFFLVSAGAAAFFGTKLFKKLGERARIRLGFEGERFVGEELARLMAHGFEVYHDVPFDGFNMDHVLVGPRGVFVVETKTRRKPIKEDGKNAYRVQFDGKLLQWPGGYEAHGIEQAKSNAKTLATWLSSATGEKVWATPILTLPGWLVERKVPSEGFHVLNPKEIYQVCSAQPETVMEPQIRRIMHQLNQKCRMEMS